MTNLYYFRQRTLQFIGSFYRHLARLQNGALRQPASESVQIRIGPDPSLRIIILLIITLYSYISDSAFPLVLPPLTGQQLPLVKIPCFMMYPALKGERGGGFVHLLNQNGFSSHEHIVPLMTNLASKGLDKCQIVV